MQCPPNSINPAKEGAIVKREQKIGGTMAEGSLIGRDTTADKPTRYCMPRYKTHPTF